jgi:Dna[CI] antecedent, DciA
MGREFDPVPIGKVLNEHTARLGMGSSDVGRLFNRWPSVVGASIADHVEPISLRNGVLRLRAETPTWATEIGYLGEEIRAQVNEALEAPLVQKVEVSVGPRTSRPGSSKSSPQVTQEPDPSRETNASRDDPMRAFERARAAWVRRRRRRS